jgi:hypothetical protein
MRTLYKQCLILLSIFLIDLSYAQNLDKHPKVIALKSQHGLQRPNLKCFASLLFSKVSSRVSSWDPSLAVMSARTEQLFGLNEVPSNPEEVREKKVQYLKDNPSLICESYVLLITGQNNSPKAQEEAASLLADILKLNVVYVQNETHGLINDCVTTVYSKMGGMHDAVTTIMDLIEGYFGQKPIFIMAHSQGSAYLNLALKKLPQEAINHLDIHILGGATHNFPPGPKYYHHINSTDLIPYFFGQYKPAQYNKKNLLDHKQFSVYSDPDSSQGIYYYYKLGRGTHSLNEYFKQWTILFKRHWDVESLRWKP